MPLTVYKRGKVYHIRGSVAGEVIRESTGTSDRTLAEAIKAQRETELHKRRVFGAKATATFLEAAVMYLEAGGEKRFVGRLIDHLGSEKLANVKQAKVDEAARALYPNAKPATLVRQVYVPVTAIMNMAAQNELCEPRRFKRPKVEKPVRRVPDADWWVKVLPECSPHLGALLLFLSVTGARISEAIRLVPEDVDRDRRTAILVRTKTGKPREVDIPPALWAWMEPLLDTDGPVFRYAANRGVYNALRSACERAGVRYHPTHELGRHTFATSLLKAGASLAHVQKLGDWSSGRLVSDTYGHLEPKDGRELLEAIAARRSPKVRKV